MIRNGTVWSIALLLLKERTFTFVFAITATVGVPCGGLKIRK